MFPVLLVGNLHSAGKSMIPGGERGEKGCITATVRYGDCLAPPWNQGQHV